MQDQKKQEGYVVVVVALVITVFLGFVALSIDVGVLLSARASAQRAADAAALAGAFAFVTHPTITAQDDIKRFAISAAAQNKIMGTPVTIALTDVDVDFANRRVTVRVDRNHPTLFARVLGENSANIHVQAIAESANSATSTSCLKPFFIPNTALSTSDPCVACWGADATPNTGDDPNPKQVLVELVNGVPQVTSWARTQIQNSTVANGLNQFLLKPQDPQQALRPGDFYLVDLGPPPGFIEEKIAQCFVGGSCGSTFSVLTGNHVGPVRQGVQNLIGCPSNRDTYVGVGQYQRPNNTITGTSKSLVAAPVWDVCNANFGGQPFCPTANVPGGTQVQLRIVGFALVFIEGFRSGNNPTIDCNGSEVIGRVIDITACGDINAGGGINPAETGPFGVPVRLVRLP